MLLSVCLAAFSLTIPQVFLFFVLSSVIVIHLNLHKVPPQFRTVQHKSMLNLLVSYSILRNVTIIGIVGRTEERTLKNGTEVGKNKSDSNHLRINYLFTY